MMRPNTKQLLDYLMAKYGNDIRLTSGYRDPARNARVGGAKNSQHMFGRAFDLNANQRWRTKDLTSFIADARAKAAALGVPLSGGYYGLTPGQGHSLHLDTRPGGGVTWGADRRGASTPEWFRAAFNAPLGPGGEVGAAGPASTQTPMVATGPEVFRESGSVPQQQMAAALMQEQTQPRDPVIAQLLQNWTYGAP